MNLSYNNAQGRNLPVEYSSNSASVPLRGELRDWRKNQEKDRKSYFQGFLLYFPQGEGYIYVGTYGMCRYDSSFNVNQRQVEHVIPQGSLNGTPYNGLNDHVLAITMYTQDHLMTLSFGGNTLYRHQVRRILNGEHPENNSIGFAFYQQNALGLETNYAKALAFVLIGYFERGLLFRYALLIIGGLIFSSNRTDNQLVQISLHDLEILINIVETLFCESVNRRLNENHAGSVVQQTGYTIMFDKINEVLSDSGANPEDIINRFVEEVHATFETCRNAIDAGQFPPFPWFQN